MDQLGLLENGILLVLGCCFFEEVGMMVEVICFGVFSLASIPMIVGNRRSGVHEPKVVEESLRKASSF